jgi:hypothetical protein
LSPEERRAAATAQQESSRKVLHCVDSVLESSGGKRLQDQPNALGTVLVETTPAGVEELARVDVVKAVMEDQGISLLSAPSRSSH